MCIASKQKKIVRSDSTKPKLVEKDNLIDLKQRLEGVKSKVKDDKKLRLVKKTATQEIENFLIKRIDEQLEEFSKGAVASPYDATQTLDIEQSPDTDSNVIDQQPQTETDQETDLNVHRPYYDYMPDKGYSRHLQDARMHIANKDPKLARQSLEWAREAKNELTDQSNVVQKSNKPLYDMSHPNKIDSSQSKIKRNFSAGPKRPGKYPYEKFTKLVMHDGKPMNEHTYWHPEEKNWQTYQTHIPTSSHDGTPTLKEIRTSQLMHDAEWGHDNIEDQKAARTAKLMESARSMHDSIKAARTAKLMERAKNKKANKIED